MKERIQEIADRDYLNDGEGDSETRLRRHSRRVVGACALTDGMLTALATVNDGHDAHLAVEIAEVHGGSARALRTRGLIKLTRNYVAGLDEWRMTETGVRVVFALRVLDYEGF
jgi:hypothetical protein